MCAFVRHAFLFFALLTWMTPVAMPKVLPIIERVLQGRMVVVIHNYTPAKGRGPLDSVKRAFGAALLTPRKAIIGSA